MTEEKEFSAMMTMEDFLRADEDAFGTPKHGDIVDGVVVRVDADEVLVDIGAKAEGIISGKELGFRGDPDNELSPGDVIKVYVLQPENEEGNVVLSRRRALAETTWLTAAEKQVLAARGLSGVRLSCQIPCDHDMPVRAISLLAGSGRKDVGTRPSPELQPQPVQWTPK